MKQKSLETTDLFKGAFLLCMGGCLTNIRVEFNGRKTATFLITGKNLDQYNTDYITGKALLNPTKLKNSLNHLRDVLFNTLREKENQRTHKENRPWPESRTQKYKDSNKRPPL